MSSHTFKTPITDMMGIKYPIMLAGMNAVAGPKLAAAVSNAGGLGVIGGVSYTPKILRQMLTDLKAELNSPDLPWGMDLLLPQVGGKARKTNVDYTQGKLPELVDIILEFKPTLFVSAVGIPPAWVVEKFHAAGIPVMNMIGSVRHVQKCFDAGIDIICCQGGEGGGHTGSVATTVLLPQVVDLCRKAKPSAFTGKPVSVVAAGGIFDGRGLAMALALGADAVWVGSRFICATEAVAPKRHQEEVIKATSEQTIRTTIYTGRPLRVLNCAYIADFEENRRDLIHEAQKTGVICGVKDITERVMNGEKIEPNARRPLLMGQAVGAVTEIKPAAAIMQEMMEQAIEVTQKNVKLISKL